jgi:hypothetical protein
MTTASSSSQSVEFSATGGRVTASPGPMIEELGLMNSLGTMTFLSTRCPPPSSMCFWKLPAMQISLPGRVSGASSLSDESGVPCALEAAVERSVALAQDVDQAVVELAARRLIEVDDDVLAAPVDDDR